MGVLAFFPWFSISENLKIENYRLVSYKRGKDPFGHGSDLQKTVDNLTESFVVHGNNPITGATLIKLEHRDLGEELNDNEIADVFLFSELFAYCNLSGRKYFTGLPIDYCNKDLFRIYVKEFRGEGKGSVVIYRRRDGTTKTIYSKDAYQVRMPDYISKPLQITPDLPLLESLLYSKDKLDSSIWETIYESIINFNLSNTDSPDFQEHVEIVLLNGAFERLLNCGGNENDLARVFENTLVPDEEMRPNDCDRLNTETILRRFRNSNSVRNLWIRDFFRFRGNLAHGKIKAQYPSVWSLKDHLLMTSFVFPLLLKCKLHENSTYNLSADDRFYINLFERLACEEHLIPRDETEEEPEQFPWQKIVSDAWFKRIFKDENSE